MEEARNRRRRPLLAALAGMLLLAAIWTTMALAGGSSPASAPAQAPAQEPDVAQVQKVGGGHADGDCPEDSATSNDL
jgi:hypothetical protein